MSLLCQYCQKQYSSNSSLNYHQKTTKSCLKIQETLIPQDEINAISYECKYCNKNFSTNQRLSKHTLICINKFKYDIKIKDEVNTTQTEQINENFKIINNLEIEIKLLKEQLNKEDPHTYISELHNKLHEIALAAVDQKNEVITNMVKKYVKKQPRKQFDCSNVIYILTTPSLKKDNRYVLGKAKNLTNRLSTYNKSDEHEVIFYQDCCDEDTMNTLEPMIFNKLKDFREQANRERFILPENKNIDFFKDTIKKCFEFLK